MHGWSLRSVMPAMAAGLALLGGTMGCAGGEDPAPPAPRPPAAAATRPVTTPVATARPPAAVPPLSSSTWAPAPTPNNDGVRAIDSARSLSGQDWGEPGSDGSGRWGGQQLPDIADAPRL